MKTVIFDLGGVVVARNPQKLTKEFIDFFSFLADKKMPHFWEEYDRGTQTMDQTIDIISNLKGYDREFCRKCVCDAITMQEAIEPTACLIKELHEQGYRLLVLSNMSLEFITFIRQLPIYKYFSGEVVSCEEGTVKPEADIYKIILERYNLEASEALFVDDRPANLEAAEAHGINTILFKRWEAEESCEAIRNILNMPKE
ncbi:MAG: HAD family phosphatase [Rikenellaceae bacterium]